jgi:hypothetical protein
LLIVERAVGMEPFLDLPGHERRGRPLSRRQCSRDGRNELLSSPSDGFREVPAKWHTWKTYKQASSLS